MNIIEIIRAMVRPYISIAVASVILATGATITGFYFGERAVKKEG